MEPSPYLPTTRRFVNPIYVRVEGHPRGGLPPVDRRARLSPGAATKASALNAGPTIDRDAAWELRSSAPRGVCRAALARTAARAGRLPRRAGDWSGGLRHVVRPGDPVRDRRDAMAFGPARPASPAVSTFREEATEEVDFAWLQWVADEQLDAAQARATRGGMGLGVVHDLAVGVHPRGPTPGLCAPPSPRGSRSARPADQYNRSARTGASRHGGRPVGRARLCALPGHAANRPAARRGIRVDHILGLFRLWWCRRPPGQRRRVRQVRPRGPSSASSSRGPSGRGGRHRRGPRHRRALGPRLPGGAGRARDVHPVVRAGLRWVRRPAAPCRRTGGSAWRR